MDRAREDAPEPVAAAQERPVDLRAPPVVRLERAVDPLVHLAAVREHPAVLQVHQVDQPVPVVAVLVHRADPLARVADQRAPRADRLANRVAVALPHRAEVVTPCRVGSSFSR